MYKPRVINYNQDRFKFLTDAVKVGAINVVIMHLSQKLYPNNLALQAFLSGSLFHISMQMLEIS